jgi:hypothetical protein
MERIMSQSAPNGHVIRFEIPQFGVAKFRPEVFANLYAENDHKSVDEILSELSEMGWDLDSMTREAAQHISLIEWIAIYGECTGKGLD